MFLENFFHLDGLFAAAQKKTVIQLRWPLVILSCYFLLYSPGAWLSEPQIHAIVAFYLLTNATLCFVAEDYFNRATFYGPLLVFDTVVLGLTLGLSGGTTPGLYVACCLTLVFSCICNNSRGLFVVTFLAPLVYGYVVLTGTMTHDASVYLGLPLPLAISIFYGYFAQVQQQKQLAIDREKQADRERRAAEEVRRQRERLEVLYQANSALMTNNGLSKILELFLETALIHLPYAAAIVRLHNPETGLLETAAVKGFLTRKLDPAASLLPSVDRVINTQTTLAIKNIYEETGIQDIGFLRSEGLVALLSVPLRAKGGVSGALAFFTRWEYDFTDQERDFAAALAGRLAIAIEHTRLYEQIERQATELRDVNKLKDDFLGVASHQLRNPLNILSRNTNMLAERTLGEISPIQENALRMMVRQCKELHAAITSILQVNMIDSNLVEPEFHETNVWEFLYELRSSYDSELAKDIKLIWDFSPDLPIVQADRAKLKLILQHIIDNAIKFTDHGYVRVSARYLAGRKVLEVEVSDTGIGIAKDDLPKIFEKFTRLDGSESDNYSGIGLGLYIVKKFVHLLEGSVDVESKVGQGSTVTIRIPASRRKLPVAEEQQALAVEREGSRVEMV